MARAKSEPKKRSSKSRPSYSAKQTPHGKAQVYMQNENNKHRASRALEPHTYRPGVHAPQQQAQQAQQHAQRAARKQQQQQQAAPRARKPHRYRPGEKALREIRHYQRSTELLIPHVKFGNLAMELFHTAKKSYKIQVATLSALQEASEDFIVGLFEDALMAATHARRITVTPADIKLALRLREK